MFVFQAEDGIRDLVRSRGLGDVYKRQERPRDADEERRGRRDAQLQRVWRAQRDGDHGERRCLLYPSDAAHGRSSVDLGGRRIIKKKNKINDEARRKSGQQIQPYTHDNTHISSTQAGQV